MQKFVFKRQLKDKGCYVELEYDVKFVDGPDCDMHFSYLADPEWQLPCRMGMHIFTDYIFKRRPGILELTIYNVHWYPADTHNLIVLFAMIQALGDSLDFRLAGLEFDSSSEAFKFPEPRSIILH